MPGTLMRSRHAEFEPHRAGQKAERLEHPPDVVGQSGRHTGEIVFDGPAFSPNDIASYLMALKAGNPS